MVALGIDVPRKGVDVLFDTFDPDGGGSIDYNELYHALKRRVALDPSLRAGSLGSIELKSLNKSSRFTRSASAGAAPLGGKRQRKAWEDVRDPKRRWAMVKEVSAREAESRVAEDEQHSFRNTMPGSAYGAHDKSRLANIFFQATILLTAWY